MAIVSYYKYHKWNKQNTQTYVLCMCVRKTNRLSTLDKGVCTMYKKLCMKAYTLTDI